MLGLIHRFTVEQGEAIERAADLVVASLADGGVLHIFGSGHSQMAAQEIYLRAGGLAAVNAILDPNLSFYGTVNSDRLERLEGYAEVLMGEQDLRTGEVVIVVSNSGLNAVPIEVAQIAGRAGCRVIAITSAAGYADVASRHSSGVRLAGVADVVIDTGTPVGDAVLSVPQLEEQVGAASTVMSSIAVQSIVIHAIGRLAADGLPPDVFRSANVAGGDERNAEIAGRLRARLPNIRI
jgi:uncharacterized phosphosugar-binding protein